VSITLVLYRALLNGVSRQQLDQSPTYAQVKESAIEYQTVKTLLRREGGPLHGWVMTGDTVDMFRL
jgi:hypothetical protein